MFLYTTIEAIAAVIIGILIAVCTKKVDGVTYSKLDKIGRFTNILLLLVYVGFSYVYLFLGMIANPRYEGFLGVLGWIVSIIMASAALFCGIGLRLCCFSFFTETCCALLIKKGVRLCQRKK